MRLTNLPYTTRYYSIQEEFAESLDVYKCEFTNHKSRKRIKMFPKFQFQQCLNSVTYRVSSMYGSYRTALPHQATKKLSLLPNELLIVNGAKSQFQGIRFGCSTLYILCQEGPRDCLAEKDLRLKTMWHSQLYLSVTELVFWNSLTRSNFSMHQRP